MQNKIIISIISFVVFLILAASTLYLSLAVLKPSIEKGEGFTSSSCLVTGTYTEPTCNNVQCVDQNDDIWWYDSWGPSYFFVYVSNGNGGSDYSDDDGGDDDGDDDDDGGEGDTGDDDGDSGGESGGDSGGDSGGGDSGGGGDDLLKGKYYMDNSLYAASTSGSAQFGYQPQEIKHKKLERKLANQSGSQSGFPTQTPNPTATTTTTTTPGTTGAAPTGSSNYNSESGSACNTCYQGIFYVQYTDSYGDTLNSSIKGLVSADDLWVSGYLGNYVNGSYYTCYYNEDSTSQVIWFQPPKYNTASLVGTIILSIVSLIFLILSIVLCALGMHHSKKQSHHHHHHHHSSGGKYKPITATAAPISAKKGFQSYHKSNGSSHGGYEETVVANNVAPYYQYNQGIAQIDFSNNNNNMNYGSINNINKPPQYGF